MRVRLLHLWQRLRSSLWFVPGCMSTLAGALALGTAAIDERLAGAPVIHPLLYSGDLAGARILLSTVASSMITVAGVTFSVTIVALSLASSQFGPRLLISFMRDRGNQMVLGTFIATFVFCLIALRSGGGRGPDFVPVASAAMASFLALCSLAVLIYFIHHVSTSMRAEHVVDTVAQDLATAVERLFPETGEEAGDDETDLEETPEGGGACVASTKTGYLQIVDEESLVELADAGDLLLRVRCRAGHFVTRGEGLVTVIGVSELEREQADRIRRHFIIGRQRTDAQDPEYGVHQLVEVALRALSPGINDPFTAMSCIDWLGATLTYIGKRRLRAPRRRGKDGKLRLLTDPITFTGMLSAGFDQIRQSAGRHPAVSIRILEALGNIARQTREPERRAAIRRQAEMTYHGAGPDTLQEKDREDLEERYKAVADATES